MSIESDRMPHLAKTISYGTIITLLVIIGSQFISYGKDLEKVTTNQKDITTINKKVEKLVDKDTVNQLLAVRDTKLEAIEDNINEIKTNQKEFQLEQRTVNREQQQLLIKILRKLPDE